MNEIHIKNVIEAAMLAASRPLQIAELAELFEALERPSVDAIREALTRLEEDYSGRGIEVKETANGYRIQVRPAVASEVSRLWPERPAKYSRALLETLALIAYRQPITRAEIEAVRGVAVNPNIIKTLLERNWVRVVGQRDVPGRPELLGTTKDFLDYFSLRSLDDLPPLAEIKAMSDVNLQLDLSKGAPTVEGEPAAAPVEGASETAADGSGAGEAVAAVASGEGGEGSAEESESSVEDGESVAEGASAAEQNADEASDAESHPRAAEASGPNARAAEAFVSEIDDDVDANGNDDDDSADEDELSADGTKGASELVAAPGHFDD